MRGILPGAFKARVTSEHVALHVGTTLTLRPLPGTDRFTTGLTLEAAAMSGIQLSESDFERMEA